MGIGQISELRRRLDREIRPGQPRPRGYELCDACGHATARWRHVQPDPEVKLLVCNFVDSKTGARCQCVTAKVP